MRGASGWRTTASAPPAVLIYHPFEEGLASDFSPDLRSRQLSSGITQNSAATACAVGTPGTSWALGTPLYPFAGGVVGESARGYLGASRDLSRAFIDPDSPLRASDTPHTIHELAGVGAESPRLRKVNVDNAGNELRLGTEPPLLGASGTNRNGTNFHAISEDAKTVYFTATPHGGEPIPTVYARVRCEARVGHVHGRQRRLERWRNEPRIL
jgi:hypothetical protein